MKRIAVVNLGCKVNRYDALALQARLDPAHFCLVDESQHADLYVVNSCTVTHAAGARSLKAVRQIARRHPDRPIVFTGCHATLAPDEAQATGAVARVVDNEGKAGLPALIAELLQESMAEVRPPFPVPDLARPVVKVQDGCDQRCAYCIVPRVRGRSRSVSVEQVLRQVEQLVGLGYPEVVLTGIHLGDYGKGLDGDLDLAGLVRRLLDATEVRRIRLSSVDPLELTPALVELVTTHPRLCAHLHLPLQSGSDTVLRAMRRPYDRARVRELLHAILAASPALAVGLDVIVGFPGEGEVEFEETRALLDELDLAYLHVFPFSRRPGTAAAGLKHRVPESITKDRAALLRELSDDKSRAFYARQQGRSHTMVVECAAAEPGWMRGTSDNYLDLVVATQAPVGSLLEVELIDAARPARAQQRRELARPAKPLRAVDEEEPA
ncbi:MAG: tRNA (N(6)-L-threonylcarbamoyladenosine(37)-C(2))-methylthiotransferase MtaB [Pseudomonadota bacterium]